MFCDYQWAEHSHGPSKSSKNTQRCLYLLVDSSLVEGFQPLAHAVLPEIFTLVPVSSIFERLLVKNFGFKATGGNRAPDLLITNQLLFRLSYGGILEASKHLTIILSFSLELQKSVVIRQINLDNP